MVAILTAGSFAGMLVDGTPIAQAAEINVAAGGQPDQDALGGPFAASTTFSVDINLADGPLPVGDDEVIEECTFAWNGAEIAAGEVARQGSAECQDGANTFTWTPAAANAAYANAASGAVTITVDVSCANDIFCEGVDDSVATSVVVVDFDAPELTNDAVRILDTNGNVVEETEFGTATDLIGGSTFSIELDNIVAAPIDPFLQTVELRTCAGSVKQTLTAPFGTTITISNIPAADLATGTGNNLAASFQLRYVDRSGNAVNTSCFNFHIDNKGPDVAWLVNPGPFIAATSFERDADFTVTEPNGLAAGGVTLAWTGPEADSSTATGAPLVADFTPDIAGTYSLRIDALDVFDNTGSATRAGVKFDPDAPELTRVDFNDNGACDAHVFLRSGTLVIGDSSSTYCEGPYTVSVFVREEFPSGGDPPTAPTITNSEFTFPNAPTASRDAGTGHTDQVVDVWKFTYTGVTVTAGSVAPFTFDVNVNEETGAPLGRSTIAPKTNIGFTTEDRPRVNFAPSGTLCTSNPTTCEGASATFKVSWVDGRGNTGSDICPAPLAANTFCISGRDPASSPFPTVELIDFATGDALAAFADADQDNEWTATWDVGYNQLEARDVVVRVVTGAVAGTSEPVRVVIDNLVRNQPPHAAMNVQPTIANTGDVVSFVDVSTDADGAIADRHWDLGDGGVSAEERFDYVYRVGGQFTARLTVTDDLDSSDTALSTVTIIPLILSGHAVAVNGVVATSRGNPTGLTVASTGEVETTGEMETRSESVRVDSEFLEAGGPGAAVVTRLGQSVAEARLQESIVYLSGNDFVDEIRVEGAWARSSSSCAASVGTSGVSLVVVGGVVAVRGDVMPPPNTVVDLPSGLAVVLNEQRADLDRDEGLEVTALRVLGPGIDISFASAATGVDDCVDRQVEGSEDHQRAATPVPAPTMNRSTTGGRPGAATVSAVGTER